MKDSKRIPYVKIISDITGEIMNPITKDNPYLHPIQRRVASKPKNNKKGIRLLVVNIGRGVILKYHVKQQLTTDGTGRLKCIYHYVDK